MVPNYKSTHVNLLNINKELIVNKQLAESKPTKNKKFS